MSTKYDQFVNNKVTLYFFILIFKTYFKIILLKTEIKNVLLAQGSAALYNSQANFPSKNCSRAALFRKKTF